MVTSDRLEVCSWLVVPRDDRSASAPLAIVASIVAPSERQPGSKHRSGCVGAPGGAGLLCGLTITSLQNFLSLFGSSERGGGATCCGERGTGSFFPIPARLGFVRQPRRGGLVEGATACGWLARHVLQPARGAALGFVWRNTPGDLRTRRGGGHRRRLLLGLERLERAQRAPELGHRRAAIAQQRLERPRPVAVADQGEPDPAARDVTLLEQLRLDAIRAREPPGGDRDPARALDTGTAARGAAPALDMAGFLAGRGMEGS